VEAVEEQREVYQLIAAYSQEAAAKGQAAEQLWGPCLWE
jgi:hypothetical protein